MVRDSGTRDRSRSIIIVGFMAAGKTTVGELLAARLGLPFIDTDRKIAADFGCSIADIFRDQGEGVFRAAEKRLIKNLLSGEPKVLSLGGGAYADPRMRKTINAHGTTVWLDPPFELIAERLARSTERPLAQGRPACELELLWNERRQAYADAHLHVETGNCDPSRTVEQILDALA